jgi:predicted nucleic acid-binding Zn ribbon protein
MIYFGTCVGYPDKLRDIAIPGIVNSMMGETYNHLTKASNGYNIFPIYEHLMRAANAQKAEALVLMHDDLEFRDPELSAKIRRVFKDPSIAIIGCVGARGVTSLNWWDGERKGYAEDSASGVYSYGFDGGDICEVDSVDGMFLILSPWPSRT